MASWLEAHPSGTVIGDPLPGAPSLAGRGSFTTGITTIHLVHPDQPDLRQGLAKAFPRYDRELLIEAWYPACPDADASGDELTDHMGRADLGNLTSFTFTTRAIRDAKPDLSHGERPVVIISHGYPGSRTLLSNLAETLSGKGYTVLSIGHADNTYPDFLKTASFESALIHRSMDQRFLLDQLPALNGQEPLSGLLDLSRIGLIGFSMGGYGALRTLGAKIAPQALEQYSSIAPLLKEPSWTGDSRVKAGILFAPATFLVDAENLENITAPTLWVCGTADHVVEYEKVRAAWQKAVHSDRILVSYTACGHNVANNPAPPCALTADWTLLKRWADPVWDTWRLNNLNAHFVTAFMGAHLQGQDTLGYFRQPLPGFVEGTDAGTAVEMLQAQ